MTKIQKSLHSTFYILLSAFAAVLFVLFPIQTVYAAGTFSISALDTVANFGTVVEVSGVPSNVSEVNFSIEKPDRNVFKSSIRADSSGNFSLDIPTDQTRVAGIYRVTFDAAPVTASFQVFPGDMDVSKSGVYTSKSFAAANGTDPVKINVKITDEFGNPLQSHETKVTSSRSSDNIIFQSKETDENGIATFLVSSMEQGVSVLTVVDESAGETLLSRPKITFFKAPQILKSVGGDPEIVLLAQAQPYVSKLLIENIPATANEGETISFQLKAVDVNGTIVTSYTGTVIFSSTDSNAKLPGSYTFKSGDQGKKTFDLGLTFNTKGVQTLTVQEQGNAVISGTKNIEVLKLGNSGNAGQIKITKPATGTYSVNTLEVAGETTPNVKVKIFDNGQQIAEVQADSSGRFSFKTSLLADGDHSFYADSNGVQSSSVAVTIDSTPAQVEQVEIEPKTLAPGDTAIITIQSDPDLSSIQATVDEFITDLTIDPKNPGVYRGTLVAPAKDGEYTVNVIITDKIGNVSPVAEVGKLKVDSSVEAAGEATFSVPSKVQNVKALPSGGKVTLSWSPATAESGIALYRIYYSTDPANLNSIVNTKDSNISWYIPNLQNGVAYYFQVAGIDSNGNESDNLSDMVSAVPSGVPVLCDPMPCPPDIPSAPQTPEDGPEVFGILAIALAGGGIWKIFKRKNVLK